MRASNFVPNVVQTAPASALKGAPFLFSVALAALSGLLTMLATQAPGLAFVALAPLFVGLHGASWWQAFGYGALAAIIPATYYALGMVPFSGGRAFEVIVILGMGVLFGAVMMLATMIWNRFPVVSGLVLLPLATWLYAWLAELPLGRFTNLWASGLHRMPWIFQVSDLGTHRLVMVLLALTASIVAVLWLERATLFVPAVAAPVLVAILVAVGLLVYAWTAHHRLLQAIETAPRVRVAAVASDLGVHDVAGVSATQGPDARTNVAQVLAVYGPLVAEAATAGAEIVVLPEAHVFLTGANRELWLKSVAAWARDYRIYFVASYIDLDEMRDLAIILGPDGEVLAQYDKQHPVPGYDPQPPYKQQPPSVKTPAAMLAAAICFDLDFEDINQAVARQGGLFAVPANDWREVAEKHHALVSWGAVASRASIIRATTHGISSLVDPAGRVIARASSLDGDVVLVGDVPVLQ